VTGFGGFNEQENSEWAGDGLLRKIEGDLVAVIELGMNNGLIHSPIDPRRQVLIALSAGLQFAEILQSGHCLPRELC